MPLGQIRTEFDKLDWETPYAGFRVKSMTRGSKRLRLIEMEPEFEERRWCTRGHTGYVLEGELEVVFDERTELFIGGDGLSILPGDAERHRARASGSTVRLILVEDV